MSQPARGLVWLRAVETPETLAHGRIILTQSTREVLTTHQMEVVSVGAPSICENEDCERYHWIANDLSERHHGMPPGLEVGAWVLVRHRSLTETHEEGLYCVHQDDVLARIDAK